MRIVVLISGRGSNMKNLIESYYDDESPAEVIKVISNNPDAEGLTVINQYHIPAVVIDHTKFDMRDDFEEALHKEIMKDEPDYICLAGFMRILSPLFIRKWPKRIINIHPSLLPAYPGLYTHKKVLEAGEIVTGCTVHFVDEGVDTGEIIVQKQVPILPKDTEESLADRVLTNEHFLYPHALYILKQEFTFRNITIKPSLDH